MDKDTDGAASESVEPETDAFTFAVSLAYLGGYLTSLLASILLFVLYVLPSKIAGNDPIVGVESAWSTLVGKAVFFLTLFGIVAFFVGRADYRRLSRRRTFTAATIDGIELEQRGEIPFTASLLLLEAVRFSLTFLFPAAVISQIIPANLATILLASLGYVWLVAIPVVGTYRRIRLLYDPAAKYEPIIRDRMTPAKWDALGRAVITTNIFFSYVTFAYAFALIYALLSRLNPKAFNVPLDVGSAIYFSIITLATVGYGDIFPVSGLARSVVAAEILTGLLYAILVLSVVATYLQKRQR